MLSGPLDADKMDYLLRDSHYTGTDYGLYDFERLFQSLTVYENKGERHLGVIEKGTAAAEAFILARDRMHWSVYYHKTTRGVENLLLSILTRAKDLLQEGKQIQVDPILQGVLQGEPIKPEAMLDFDDVVLHASIRAWKKADDRILSDLSRRYLNRDL